MKNKFYIGTLIMLSLSLMSMTCSSSVDDITDDTSQEIEQIQDTATSGVWKITSYIDSGQDETNDFTGYEFIFESNGVLTASNGNNTLTGTWSITDSNSNSSSDDDDSSSDIDFNIFFPVAHSHDFEDLNDDWEIVIYDDNTISLIDISGGNGGTDTLVFEKIN